MQGANKQQNIVVGESEPRQQKRSPSSVALRWLSALVLIPVVLMFVWFGGWIAFIATLAIVVIGSFELNYMLSHSGHRSQLWVMLLSGILFLVSAMFPLYRSTILEFGLSGVLLTSFTALFFRRRLEGAIVDWALSIAIGFYLGWTTSHFLLLRGDVPGQLSFSFPPHVVIPVGAWWVLAALPGVWAFDAAAFFAGRHFGRRKLAPMISPAKTWEGALGGLIFCTLSCLVITVIPLGLPWYLALVLAVLISVSATLGDLAESLIKRQMNVKDSGQIVPGHGGLLDRVDSSLFAVVVVYLFVQLLQIWRF